MLALLNITSTVLLIGSLGNLDFYGGSSRFWGSCVESWGAIGVPLVGAPIGSLWTAQGSPRRILERFWVTRLHQEHLGAFLAGDGCWSTTHGITKYIFGIHHRIDPPDRVPQPSVGTCLPHTLGDRMTWVQNKLIHIISWQIFHHSSEVGGSESTIAGTTPRKGNRFVSFVRMCAQSRIEVWEWVVWAPGLGAPDLRGMGWGNPWPLVVTKLNKNHVTQAYFED